MPARSCARLIPRGAIDQDAYEDAGVFTLETGARLLAEWVGECWHEASGGEFTLPAYIGHHDRSAQYDLRLKTWGDESDIWEYACASFASVIRNQRLGLVT